MLLFVALVVTAYMFFGQRTKAPRLVIAILVASFILDAVDAAWRISFAEGDSEYVVQVMAPLAAFWPIRIVWLLYWTLSKRVKETFVYPLQASEGVAANR